MSEIQKALDSIKQRSSNLINVVDPHTIQPGSIEIDEQLFKLGTNLRILQQIKYIASKELSRLKYDYNCKMRDHIVQVTAQILEDVAMVKSNKMKYIKVLMAEEERDIDEMTANFKYFDGIFETYCEWVNLFKKVRGIPHGQS